MSGDLELGVPGRVSGSFTGAGFCSTILNVSGETRDLAVRQQLESGNMPSFFRSLIPVTSEYEGHSCTFWTAPDYLAVGDDTDYVRLPLGMTAAFRVCKYFDASLPTRHMVNLIWEQAAIKLPANPLPPTDQMTGVAYMLRHNEAVERSLQSVGKRPWDGLVAGHKKDLVITRAYKPGKVAIYGWHGTSGKPIQGPQIQSSAHADAYADYSHGVRLVANLVVVDEEFRPLEEVLASAELCGLLSDEGPFTPPPYS